MAAEPTELHTYHGNCHCGAFKFAVRLPEVDDVYACNCSICLKVSAGSLLVVFG